jgi:hypothetical protein
MVNTKCATHNALRQRLRTEVKLEHVVQKNSFGSNPSKNEHTGLKHDSCVGVPRGRRSGMQLKSEFRRFGALAAASDVLSLCFYFTPLS